MFKTRITSAEFLSRPETLLPTELINGEIFMSPAPLLKHQRLVFTIAKLIEALAQSGEVLVAPVDVYLGDLNVVQPDVLWISPDNVICIEVEGKYLKGAPDLVVEVHSPSTEKLDRSEKFTLYRDFGVREYWMVDPDAELIEVWSRQQDTFARLGVFGCNETFTSPVLNNAVDISAIFDI
jgi:Uma2 family endonuclease